MCNDKSNVNINKLNLTQFNNIDNEKIVNKNKAIQSRAKKDAKNKECFNCGSKNLKLCYSHSIPQFVLRNISVNGNLYNFNKILQTPSLKQEDGLKRTGTFLLICKECDNSLFSKYENPDSYNDQLNEMILSQIALKNYLKLISKRKIEIEIYNHQYKSNLIDVNIYEKFNSVSNKDLNEYIFNYKGINNILKKENTSVWRTIFYYKLNYRVPIAFQGAITLTVDLDGSIINNTFKKSEAYKLQDVHICVFPLKSNTVILFYANKKYTRYRRFIKQFSNKEDNIKIKIINYILFLYTEDVYISKNIKLDLKNHKLLEVCGETSIFNSNISITEQECKRLLIDTYNLFDLDKIPNLLSKEYSIST